MAKRVIDDSTLTAIADKLRENAPSLEGTTFTPTEMPGKIGAVYNSGKAEAEQAAAEEKAALSLSLSEALTSGASNTESLETNVEQAKADLAKIKSFITKTLSVDVPVGTPTSSYTTHLLSGVSIAMDDARDDGYSVGAQVAENKPYIDTSKITNFSYFCNENHRTDLLNKLDTSNGTSFRNMFYYCKSLTTIPELNTSNGTDFRQMFCYCYALTTIPELNTSKGTNFGQMFGYCYALTTIPELNTSKGTNFEYMFADCTSLTTIPELDTSNGTDFGSMFYNCTSLTTIPKLDVSKGTYIFNIFGNCSALENIVIEGVIGLSFDIRYSTKLTHESLMSIINALKDNSASSTTYKLTIGSDNIAKLTEDEQKMVTTKGWTLA